MATKGTPMIDARTTKSRRPFSPRRQRYWAAIALATVTGFAGGMLLLRGQSVSGGELIGNGPLSAALAIGAAVLWMAGMAICSILYHYSVDDHEEQAWLRAGLAGWYAFAFATPTWWLLHRAALVPPVDAMLLFAGSLVINTAVYLWFKFR